LLLGEACIEIQRLASSGARDVEALASALESRLRAGTLARDIGQALLDALQTGSTPTGTVMRPAASVSEGTLVRGREPGAFAATLLRDAAPSATLLRPIQRGAESAIAAELATRRAVSDDRPSAAHPEATPSPELAPGAVIKERFVLEEPIGRGGMGTVFRALDRSKEIARNPNPHVAIKILNAGFRDHPQALMALEREASKAQSLAHPNIVTVFDFDLAGATPFITMELLEGSPLEGVIANARPGGVSRVKALPIIRGIAEGLAYAHRKGIVHSDLKPGNVFLLEDGTPKILDFGIARAIPAMRAQASAEDVFDVGSLGAYTESYATQEMIAGSDPSPADDLYALGLIAYELLTGRHPFRGESAAKARELALKPTPIRALKRREWKAVECCLAFERRSRPRDAADFIRIFFGVTPLTKMLLAAAVAGLGLVCAYLWYQNMQETGPLVPLSALPPATQQQVLTALNDGRTAWRFYEKDHNMMALWDAVDRYDEAYKLHPRNREAVQGLKRAADALLDRTDLTVDTRRDLATRLRTSEYLSRYKPVVDAAGGH
jgi:protein kinase-like protein